MRDRKEKLNHVTKICRYCSNFFQMKREDIANGRKAVCNLCLDLTNKPDNLGEAP